MAFFFMKIIFTFSQIAFFFPNNNIKETNAVNYLKNVLTLMGLGYAE